MTQKETYEESKPNTMKFGEVGDYILGTLVDVGETTSPDKWGKFSKIYTIKGLKGSYHDIVEGKVAKEPTEVNEGEEYAWFLNKDKGIVIKEMKKLKFGQKFMLEFTEERENDKGNPTKIIKVKPGMINGKPAMDEEWVENNKERFEEQDAEEAARKSFDAVGDN